MTSTSAEESVDGDLVGTEAAGVIPDLIAESQEVGRVLGKKAEAMKFSIKGEEGHGRQRAA